MHGRGKHVMKVWNESAMEVASRQEYILGTKYMLLHAVTAVTRDHLLPASCPGTAGSAGGSLTMMSYGSPVS